MNISPEGIYGAIKQFLELVETDKTTEVEDLTELALCLDQLALAYRFVNYEYDDRKYQDPPSLDYKQLRESISKRFPEFGFYNQAEFICQQIGESDILVHDALDDLADIAVDLQEVKWRWKNTSRNDALWCFKFGYESHWGEHLRHLQLYVHAFPDRL